MNLNETESHEFRSGSAIFSTVLPPSIRGSERRSSDSFRHKIRLRKCSHESENSAESRYDSRVYRILDLSLVSDLLCTGCTCRPEPHGLLIASANQEPGSGWPGAGGFGDSVSWLQYTVVYQKATFFQALCNQSFNYKCIDIAK